MPATATACPRFSDVLEIIDRLSIDEQHDLVAIVEGRLGEARRRQIVDDVEASRREFAEGQGRCRAATVDEIMAEILP